MLLGVDTLQISGLILEDSYTPAMEVPGLSTGEKTRCVFCVHMITDEGALHTHFVPSVLTWTTQHKGASQHTSSEQWGSLVSCSVSSIRFVSVKYYSFSRS